MAETAIMMALMNAADGQDDAYNDWYDKRHVPDVLKIPGVKSARRFRVAKGDGINASTPWQYLTIYEVEQDKLRAISEEVRRRIGTEAMPISPALDEKRLAWFFEEMPGRG